MKFIYLSAIATPTWSMDLHPANVGRATDAMRWRMEATEMFCLHIKFVICTNQNQPLKFAGQNSYLDL